MLFDPKQCWKELQPKNTAAHELSKKKKYALAEKMIERRNMFRDRANKVLTRGAISQQLVQ